MLKKIFLLTILFAICSLPFAIFAQDIKQLEEGEGMEKYKDWMEKQKEDVPEETEVSRTEVVPGKPEEVSKEVMAKEEVMPTISMDFQDAGMKDILKIFSQQSGLNFIAGEKIKDSKITLYLDKVSIEDALNTILKGNNLTYEQAPDSDIFIVKQTSEPEIETATKVFTLNYAQVNGGNGDDDGDDDSEEGDGMQEVIENILTEHGKVICYDRTNSLIVTDIPSNFKRIEKTIKEIDTPTPMVMIEAEILETKVGLVDELGIDWSAGIAITYTAPGTHSTNFPFSEDLIHATGGFTAANITAADTKAILKALSTDTRTRWLAKPKICVLNNEEATIDIITDAAVGKITVIDADGNRTESIERMDIGTKLTVTPHVNKAGEIVLEIEPEESRATDSAAAITGAVDKLTRTAKTKVIVKDGNTVIIGGLISTKKGNTIHKVPFLGDIPFAGNLFKYEKETEDQTELVIFITPSIVRYWEETPTAASTQFIPSAEETVFEEEILQLEPIIVN